MLRDERVSGRPEAIVLAGLPPVLRKGPTHYRRHDMDISRGDLEAKLVAFYHPQFHATPFNDEIYGVGYTEWDNVERARPMFDGHRQPFVPGELGRYDLGEPSVYPRQVALAQQYGIDGFCFYYYWFPGNQRQLEKPFEMMLASDVDFPFCAMWTNHDWTLAWHGRPHEVVLEMTYAVQDPRDFLCSIAPALNDDRYIRVDGRPLLPIYETSDPAISEWIGALRAACRATYGTELYIVGVQRSPGKIPVHAAVDALLEFPPNGYSHSTHADLSVSFHGKFAGRLFDYRKVALASALDHNLETDINYFRTVFPGWDNTGRRMDRADPTIFLNSSPEWFSAWLAVLLAQGRSADHGRVLPAVFINAWNEWGEGAYLEPDAMAGRERLEAVAQARETARNSTHDELIDALVRMSETERVAAPRARAKVAAKTTVQLPVVKEQLRQALETSRNAVLQTTAPVEQTQTLPHAYSQRLVFRFFGSAMAHDDPLVVAHGSVVAVRGFAVDTIDITPSTPLTLVVHGVAGTYEAVKIPRTRRLDIAESHSRADNLWAGFACTLDFSHVPVGEYRLLAVSGDRQIPCQQPLTVGPAVPSLFEPAYSYSNVTRATDPTSAHGLALAAVQALDPSSALDVGCWTGAFLESLQASGISATGLELNTDSAATARALGFDVVVADLEADAWAQSLDIERFDVVTYLDVLEHLVRPDRALAQTREILTPDGHVVASIPNVAHVSLRLSLLVGQFRYADDGLLDRTHLRFFTRQSIEQLFREAGYVIDSVEKVRRPAAAGGFNLPASLASLEDVVLSLDPDADAFQYIVTAHPTPTR